MSVDNLSGQTFGQYELRDRLGAGGMGAVYRAYQRNLRREVAIKVISLTLSQQSGYVERFLREAETSARLENAHIIPIYDFGTQGSLSYIVMRLLTGGSLTDRLQQRPDSTPSLGEIASLLGQLANALDYAHSQGVIHRDIKPSNVMFDHNGTAFVVDFGVAYLAQATTALTGTGTTLGTPLYMPPEQWRNENLSAASDQYALAVMTYQMVTGRVPFTANTPFALMHLHLNEMPTPPQVARADVPEAVTLVLQRALAKKPEDRFPNVTAFAQAFQRAIAGHEGETTGYFTFKLRRESSPSRPISGSGSRPSVPISSVQQPLYRRPLVWGFAAIIVALLLLVVALALVPSGDGGLTEQQTRVVLNITQTALAGGEDSNSVIQILPSAIFTPTASTTPTVTPSATNPPTVTPIPATPTPRPAELTRVALETVVAEAQLATEAAQVVLDVTNTAGAEVAAAMQAATATAAQAAAATRQVATIPPTPTVTVTPSPRPAELTRVALETLVVEAQIATEAAQVVLDVTNTAAAQATNTAQAATATRMAMTDTPTPTFIPTPTLVPTPTATATLVPTSIPSPTLAAVSQEGANTQWTPVIQDFDGIAMVLVPAGCFMMGSNEGEANEQPEHQQCFAQPFWMGRYEVTNGQYGSSGGFSGSDRPRERVTYFEAEAFCQSRGLRLPTEAEWEYAARGPESWVFPWGNSFVGDNLVYRDGQRTETAFVGSKPAGISWVGALDMAGNVWEWTSSIHAPYPYVANDGRENSADRTSYRVIKGGSWDFGNSSVSRAAYRAGDGYSLTASDNGIGFRCARDDESAAAVAPVSMSGQIAFRTNRDGNWEIYMMNVDGSGMQNLSNNIADDQFPAWSPDGNQIAFASNRDGNSDIYVMNADGTDPRNLTNQRAEDTVPAWSPDGRQIAFTAARTGNWEIFVMNADGSNPRNLSSNSAEDFTPSWSPDGSQIAFHSNRDGDFDIYIMNADGGNVRRITDNSTDDLGPTWSPDGNQIAFYSKQDGDYEIYIINIDGSGLQQLTLNDDGDPNNNSDDDISPHWSSDGTQIVFSSRRDGNINLYVMNRDGSNPIPLTRDSTNESSAAWKPGQIALPAPAQPASAVLSPTTVDCLNSPPSRLNVGMQATVIDVDPNHIRLHPQSAEVRGEIPSGGVFDIIGGPECGQSAGLIWWEVSYQGVTGWTAEGKGDQYWIAPYSASESSVTTTVTIVNTPVPDARPTCPGTLISQLQVGHYARVTPGDRGNRLRSQPTTSGEQIGLIPAGRFFRVVDGPVCADNYAWWKVYHSGQIGWTVEADNTSYWLEPIDVSNASDLILDDQKTVDQFTGAFQGFEHGYMFWVQPVGEMWVLTETSIDRGTWRAYADTWQLGDPEPVLNTKPGTLLFQPIRGFGKVWYENQGVRDALGWAKFNEIAVTISYEYRPTTNVHVLTIRDGRFELSSDGTWQKVR